MISPHKLIIRARRSINSGSHWVFLSVASPHLQPIEPIRDKLKLAEQDDLVLTDEQLRAYDKALEPKELVTLDGGHFDAYVEKFEESSEPACNWFADHLLEE